MGGRGGGGGPKAQNNAPPKNDKPQQAPSAPNPEKKKKQRAPKKAEKEDEKEGPSLVQTTVARNMKEINDITALIAYLRSLLPKDSTSTTSPDRKNNKGFGQDERVAEDDPMAALFNSKPQPKKKKKRRKKVVKDLKHSMNYYKLFNMYDVDYPQKVEEVPDCIDALKKKLAEYQDDGKQSKKAPAKEKTEAAETPAKAEAEKAEAEEPQGDVVAAGGSGSS